MDTLQRANSIAMLLIVQKSKTIVIYDMWACH